MTHEDDYREQVKECFRGLSDLLYRYGIEMETMPDGHTLSGTAANLLEATVEAGLREIRRRRGSGAEQTREMRVILSGVSFLHVVCSPADGGCGSRDVREVETYAVNVGQAFRAHDFPSTLERGRLAMCAACGHLINVF